MSNVLIYLPATSAMWDFNPNNVDGGWTNDKNGRTVCQAGNRCGAEIINAQFNQVEFVWAGSDEQVVSVGVDGQLLAGKGSAGSAQVPVTQGVHTARIQIEQASGSRKGKDFGLIGATLSTTASFSTPPQNYTLDDASSAITYTGWTSTTSSSAPTEAIRSGKFSSDTISYTSTSGSSASFTFKGQFIYIFGCTGPSFGTFQVNLDGTTCGIYNATASINTYGTLLFVGQVGEGDHKVEITNMVDGRLLALDYFVATSAGTTSGGGEWTTIPVAAPVIPPVSHPQPSSIVGHPIPKPSASPGAVFPGGEGQVSEEGGTSNSALIGGILGALFGILFLFILWRYRQFKKQGGEGSFFATLCGPSRKPPQTAGTGKNDFKLWPMVRFRPKYAT